MASAEAPTKAHTILDAVRLTTDGEISALRQLAAQRPDALTLEILLRILLTYIPEGTDPGLYVDLIQDIATERPNPRKNYLRTKPDSESGGYDFCPSQALTFLSIQMPTLSRYSSYIKPAT